MTDISKILDNLRHYPENEVVEFKYPRNNDVIQINKGF